MRKIDHTPARLSSWISVGAAFIALGSCGFYSWITLAIGTLGFMLLIVGLVRGASAAVTVGAFGLFAGAIIAGAIGTPVVPVLVSVTGTVVAWDAGGNAISIGEQLGRETDTVWLETVHTAGSVAVGVTTAVAGYGLYQTATGGQPVATLVFTLIAAVLLVHALG